MGQRWRGSCPLPTKREKTQFGSQGGVCRKGRDSKRAQEEAARVGALQVQLPSRHSCPLDHSPHLSHRLSLVPGPGLLPLALTSFCGNLDNSVWPPSGTCGPHLSSKHTLPTCSCIYALALPYSASGLVPEHLLGGALPASPLKSQAFCLGCLLLPSWLSASKSLAG